MPPSAPEPAVAEVAPAVPAAFASPALATLARLVGTAKVRIGLLALLTYAALC